MYHHFFSCPDGVVPVSAQPSHHAALADLFEAVFIGEGYAPASSRERLRNIAKIADAGLLLVATGPKGNEVFGAVFCVEISSPLCEIARYGEAEMRLLAVHSHYRGQGLGSKLIRACIAHAAKSSCNSLVLSTQPLMLVAQSLFQREGFKRVPSQDWTHSNGSERLVFSRPLVAN